MSNFDRYKPDYVSLKPAVVRHVCLNIEDPLWLERPDVTNIGALLFEYLNTDTGKAIPGFHTAYPVSRHVNCYPTSGEIVYIQVGLGLKSDVDSTPTGFKNYYHPAINFHNGLGINKVNVVDETFPQEPLLVGKPLNLYEGDTVVAGRELNSIRLTDHDKNLPGIYLSNRRKEEEIIFEGVYENVNKDGSSIQMLSSKTELEQTSTKKDTYSKVDEDVPKSIQNYEKDQIIIKSGRVFIDGREDLVEITGGKDIGVSGQRIHIDGKDYIAFDADKIYLSSGAFKKEQPAVNGSTLENWLQELLDTFTELKDKFSELDPASLNTSIIDLNRYSTHVLNYRLNTLKKRLSDIKSTRVFLPSNYKKDE